MFTWTDTLDNGIGVTAYLSMGNLDTAGVGGVSLRNSNIGFMVTLVRFRWVLTSISQRPT